MIAQVLIGEDGSDQGPWRGPGPEVVVTDPDTLLFRRGLVLAMGLSAPTWTLTSYLVLR